MTTAQSSARRHLFGRTLRTRLTISLVLVLLLACTATGVATILFLRGFLLSRLDGQLSSASSRFVTNLEHGRVAPGGNDADADNAVPGQSVGTLGVRLVDGQLAQHAIVREDGKDATPNLTTSDIAKLGKLRVGANPTSVHLDAAGDYRVQAVAEQDGDVLITGLPLHPINETLARLAAIELAIFAIVLVASGATTAFIVRRTLRPLRRVAATALHVSELPLTDADTPLPPGLSPTNPTTEIDQVSVAFDHMLDHLRNSFSTRDATEERLRQFVADASHELRTPLATIQASAEAAGRKHDLPSDTQTALARINASTHRMGALVDDLLLLARLDAGRPLARDTVDMTRLILDAIDEARTAAPQHRWRLDLPDQPLSVQGDQHRLHQVLSNLLTNARIHTPEGTTITASLAAKANTVVVSVHDNGPGIPAAQRQDLFARFTRGDRARTAPHGSTGLGLAIAHGIAHAHHGTLTVASRPGDTTFTLTLPTNLKPETGDIPVVLDRI